MPPSGWRHRRVVVAHGRSGMRSNRTSLQCHTPSPRLAGRCIAASAGFRLLPAPRIHVCPAAEQSREQRDLGRRGACAVTDASPGASVRGPACASRSISADSAARSASSWARRARRLARSWGALAFSVMPIGYRRGAKPVVISPILRGPGSWIWSVASKGCAALTAEGLVPRRSPAPGRDRRNGFRGAQPALRRACGIPPTR